MLGASLTASVVLVGSLAGAATGAARRPAETRSYVVRPGDTLWRIAERQVGERRDPRPYVDRLVEMNHLRDATVVQGERLALPAA